MANILQLPREPLVRIFSYYTETENQEKLVKILGKVCEPWEMAVKDDCLWDTFDGTLNYIYLLSFSKKGLLLNTRDLKFSKLCKMLTSKQLSIIYTNLPRVKRLDFSNVQLPLEDFFINLKDKCPDLCEIVISNENTQIRKQMSDTIWNFFTLRGSKITHLDISNSNYSNVNRFFSVIARTCPNMEELLAQNLGSTYACFPIDQMQLGCPKLRVLRLGFPIRYCLTKSEKSCPGFKELEVFTHCATQDYEFSEQGFLRLLFLSEKLKVLDIRGCALLSGECVCSLQTKCVERLFISRTPINISKHLGRVLKKWSLTLKELDVSRTDMEDINNILLSVISFPGMPKLERLTLSSTKLNPNVLKLIILNCKHLEYLQIEGCRRIGRRLMHVYDSRKELKKLLLKLNELPTEF